MEITILAEDTAPGGRLMSEHGFSAFVEFKGAKILFDTGQSGLFIENAKKLGIGLDDVDFVVLSHGHYDHTGGLPFLVKEFDLKDATLVAHPLIFEKKFWSGRGDIGCSIMEASLRPLFKEIILTKKPYRLDEDVCFTGEVPRQYESPESVGHHYEGGMAKPDFMPDDCSLVFNTKKGLVVLAGCAHAGILNIVKYAQRLYKQDIYCVVGGFHLLSASQERVDRIISEFKEMNISRIHPGHCTGSHAIAEMEKKLNAKRTYTGDIIKL